MLTSKSRAYLRSLAHSLDPIFQVGKGGVNDNMITQITDTLEARELIKCRVLETSPQSAKEAADAIAKATESNVVCVIGRCFVLYKESVDNKIIVLP